MQLLYLLSLFPDLCSIIQSTATRGSFWKHKSDQVPHWLQKEKKIKWLHISFGIKTKLFTVACEVLLIIWPCYLSELSFFFGWGGIYKTSFCFPNMPNSLIPHSFHIWFLCLECFLVDCLRLFPFRYSGLSSNGTEAEQHLLATCSKSAPLLSPARSHYPV